MTQACESRKQEKQTDWLTEEQEEEEEEEEGSFSKCSYWFHKPEVVLCGRHFLMHDSRASNLCLRSSINTIKELFSQQQDKTNAENGEQGQPVCRYFCLKEHGLISHNIIFTSTFHKAHSVHADVSLSPIICQTSQMYNGRSTVLRHVS